MALISVVVDGGTTLLSRIKLGPTWQNEFLYITHLTKIKVRKQQKKGKKKDDCFTPTNTEEGQGHLSTLY